MKKRSKGVKRRTWWAEHCRRKAEARADDRTGLGIMVRVPVTPVTPLDDKKADEETEDVAGPKSPDLFGPETPAADEEDGPKTSPADEEDGSSAGEVTCLLVSCWWSKLVMEALLATFMHMTKQFI